MMQSKLGRAATTVKGQGTALRQEAFAPADGERRRDHESRLVVDRSILELQSKPRMEMILYQQL